MQLDQKRLSVEIPLISNTFSQLVSLLFLGTKVGGVSILMIGTSLVIEPILVIQAILVTGLLAVIELLVVLHSSTELYPFFGWTSSASGFQCLLTL